MTCFLLSSRVKREGGGLRVTLIGPVLLMLVVGTSAVGAFHDDNGWVHEPAIDALEAEGILDGTKSTGYSPRRVPSYH